jgi:hypothetical protein
MVAGSNPARGANKINLLVQIADFDKIASVGSVWANRLPHCLIDERRAASGYGADAVGLFSGLT